MSCVLASIIFHIPGLTVPKCVLPIFRLKIHCFVCYQKGIAVVVRLSFHLRVTYYLTIRYRLAAISESKNRDFLLPLRRKKNTLSTDCKQSRRVLATNLPPARVGRYRVTSQINTLPWSAGLRQAMKQRAFVWPSAFFRLRPEVVLALSLMFFSMGCFMMTLSVWQQVLSRSVLTRHGMGVSL